MVSMGLKRSHNPFLKSSEISILSQKIPKRPMPPGDIVDPFFKSMAYFQKQTGIVYLKVSKNCVKVGRIFKIGEPDMRSFVASPFTPIP